MLQCRRKVFWVFAAALFLLWILFNGRLTWEIAAFGVVIAVALAWFVQRFVAEQMTLKRQWRAARHVPQYLHYIWLLVKEITLANFAVMRLILSDRDIVVPKLASFETTLRTRTARVVLADCITLTPGTITVHLHDGEYLVHCLDESFEEGLTDSSFERRLTVMEEEWLKEEQA